MKIIVVDIDFSFDVFVGRVGRVLGWWVPWVEGDVDRRVLSEVIFLLVGPMGKEMWDRVKWKLVICCWD